VKRLWVAVLLAVCVCFAAQDGARRKGVTPTAIAIARAVLIAIYGRKQIEGEEPL
jgi:1-acyl-sn-glycerol-3-phosphate acyltransferase